MTTVRIGTFLAFCQYVATDIFFTLSLCCIYFESKQQNLNIYS